MYQIKVNSVFMPTIYWSLSQAIAACKEEANRGVAVMTDIVSIN
jgi:hypothetical protein